MSLLEYLWEALGYLDIARLYNPGLQGSGRGCFEELYRTPLTYFAYVRVAILAWGLKARATLSLAGRVSVYRLIECKGPHLCP